MTQVATPKEPYPGFAYHQALDNMGGNTQLMVRLAELFLRQHASDHLRIAAALQQQDRSEALYLAHALRGTAANIGGMAVHDAAYQLEILLDDGDDIFQASTTDLQEALDEFVSSLRRLIVETARAQRPTP